MSNFSSSRRLQNDIADCEKNSDRKIAPDMYYIVCIELCKQTSTPSSSSSTNMVKNLLRTRKDHFALVGYVYDKEIYLLFSSVGEGNHYLEGSHQAICSEYASMASIEFGCRCVVKIIELESRTMVLVYFQTKLFENAKRSAHLLSKNTISKKEIGQFTFGEIIQALQSRASIEWDKIPAAERFGVFYKYALGNNNKEKFIVLSELVNVQEKDKYISYFFD